MSNNNTAEATTTTAAAANGLPKLYNIKGTLVGDVEIRTAKTANGDKPMAYAKVTATNGKTVTITTLSAKAVEYLQGKKDGESIRIYGTFNRSDKGTTFSAIGESIPKPKAEEQPSLAI